MVCKKKGHLIFSAALLKIVYFISNEHIQSKICYRICNISKLT